MASSAPGFDLFRSDRHWNCDCGDMVQLREEYAVRLRDNEEMCMTCYTEETRYGARER